MYKWLCNARRNWYIRASTLVRKDCTEKKQKQINNHKQNLIAIKYIKIGNLKKRKWKETSVSLLLSFLVRKINKPCENVFDPEEIIKRYDHMHGL